jgi:hypothetical protein
VGTGIAVALLVFGRGVTSVGGRYALTAGSLARVRAAVDYVTSHEVADGRPRVVFTGGWAWADTGDDPPVGCREGDLMLRAAVLAGLDRYADLYTETRSRSTLENLLHTVEDGLLGDRSFTAARPLGIVSHRWHLPRVRYLVGKLLDVRGAALLDIPATDGAPLRPWWAEHVLHAGSRLCFLGASDPDVLRRRERLLVSSVRFARRRRATSGLPDMDGPA